MRVPEYQQQVRQQALPNVKQSIDTSLGNFTNSDATFGLHAAGQAMDDIARATAYHQKEEVQKANNLRVQDAANQLAAHDQDAAFGEKGWRNVQGANVFLQDNSRPLTDNVLDERQKRISEISASLGTVEQRQAFAAHADQSGINLRGHLMGHEAEQHRVYAKDVLSKGIDTESKNIQLYYNDPEALKQSIDKIHNYGGELGQLENGSPESGKIKAQGIASNALKAAISASMQHGDHESATNIVNHFADHFDPNDLVNVRNGVSDEWAASTAQTNPSQLKELTNPSMGWQQHIPEATRNQYIPRVKKYLAQGMSTHDAILKAEGGSDTFDANGQPKASSDGLSIGTYQVTDKTASGPGFNIAPAKERTHAEYNRVGKELIAALDKKYQGDPEKIAAAYNSGSKTVDDALAADQRTGTPADLMTDEQKLRWNKAAQAKEEQGRAQFKSDMNNVRRDDYYKALDGKPVEILPYQAFQQAYGDNADQEYAEYTDQVEIGKDLNSIKTAPRAKALAELDKMSPQLSSKYGLRPDGTAKGTGYLGELKRPDGGVMTEYSVGVEINGKEMDIPTIVPTLSKDEVNYLLNIKDGEKIPESIIQKAVDHAELRIKQGLPVWHDTPQENSLSGDYARAHEHAAKVKAAYMQIDAERTKDVIAWAAKNGYPITPINPANMNQTLQEITKRASLAPQLKEAFGVSAILSKEDAGKLSDVLESGPENDQLQLLQGLRMRVHDSNDYHAMIQQIRPDSPATRIAGHIIGEGNDILDGTEAAKMVLRGEKMLNPGKDTKGDNGNRSSFAIPKDFNSSFYGRVGDAFNGNMTIANEAMQAVRAHYIATVQNKTADYVDSETLTKSINAVTGGLVKHADSKVIPPYGMSEDDFRTKAYEQFKAQTGQSIGEFNRLPIIPLGNGKYRLKSGSSFLIGKQGVVELAP